ncbi:MAG TPA: ATP/GTP-binding protein [Aggregatilineales bacterium]|nr:ATP/GTP-binding protein [Aggregatilineales bacterium]
MSNLYKIIVTGPFNSGKTTFVSTISDIPVVSTERKITTEDRGVKAETTVAMDYGRVTLDGRVLHLNGTPGQTRFDFMWEILATEMDGFIVLIDSTDETSFPDANELIQLFFRFKQVPYLVVANKADMPGAASLSQVRRETSIDDAVTVMPCDSTSKSSVRQVLLQVIELIESNR